MKKLLFGAVAIATLLITGSCQKENFGAANGNTVAYTVQVPGNIATKAIGDNVSSVTKLVYAVYRTEAQTANDYSATETLLYQKNATLENGQATLYLELVNNQNFRVLFWAQDPNAGIYDASNLKNVTIDYANLDANQESYAAFAGSDFIKTGDNLSGRTVYLHRAVAQLNIATTPESMILGEAGANETSSLQTTVTLTSSKVTVNGLASTYNVADASVGEILTADFVFSATNPAVLSEQILDVKGVNYKYISMNYVGFAPAMGTDVEVDYVIETNVGTIPNSISSVPVKPNYRTNIIGNLITSTSDYTVILDKGWEGDNIIANNASEFQSALNSAVSGDIINLAAGTYSFPASSFKSGLTLVCDEGTEFTGTSSLNIKGATVDGATFKNEGGMAVSGTIDGTLKNCIFDGSETLRWCYTSAGKTVVFENCVIKTTLRGIHFDEMNGDVIFRNCEINGFNAYSGAGTMTFEGCTFGCDASNYNGLNIYTNTVLKDCTFNYVSGKTNFIDMEGTGKTLTIENCTVTLDGAAAQIQDFIGGSQLANNTVIFN